MTRMDHDSVHFVPLWLVRRSAMQALNNRNYHDAPEVVPAQPGLEYVTHSTLEADLQASSRLCQKDNTTYSSLETHPSQFASLEHFKPDLTVPNSPTAQTSALTGLRDVGEGYASGLTTEWARSLDRRPIWRRKRYWIAGCVGLLVILGIVLGIVLGVMNKRQTL